MDTDMKNRLEDANKVEAMGVKIQINVNDLIRNVNSKEGYEKIVDTINISYKKTFLKIDKQ